MTSIGARNHSFSYSSKISEIKNQDKSKPITDEIKNEPVVEEEIKQYVNENSPNLKIRAASFTNKLQKLSEKDTETNYNPDINKKTESASDPNSFSFVAKKNKSESTTKIETQDRPDSVSEVKTTSKVEKGPSDYTQKLADKTKENIQKLIVEQKKVPSGSVNSNLFSQKEMYLFSDSLTQIDKIKLLSPEKMKEMNTIMDKITTGDPISDKDLSKLKEFNKVIVENSDKLGLNKATYEKLGSLIDGVISARTLVKDKKDEFLKQAEETGQKLKKLVNVVSDPNLKIDGNFTEMLKVLERKYDMVKNSGDPIAIMIFSSYVDKIMASLEDIKTGNEKDPLVFSKLKEKYEQFTENLLEKLGNNQLPPEEELKGFFGSAAKAAFSLLKHEAENGEDDVDSTAAPSVQDGKKDTPFQQFNPEYKSVSSEQTEKVKTQNRPKRITFRLGLLKLTVDESGKLISPKLSAVQNAMSNQNVSNSINDVRSSINKLSQSFSSYSAAVQTQDQSLKDLRNFANSKESEQQWNQLIKSHELMSMVLSDIVTDLIQSADKMQDSLNLEVDGGAANIVNLLEKFRSIIVNLDLELRKNTKKNKASKFIDDNFLKSVKETKDRSSRLDKIRTDAIVEMAKHQEKLTLK